MELYICCSNKEPVLYAVLNPLFSLGLLVLPVEITITLVLFLAYCTACSVIS